MQWTNLHFLKYTKFSLNMSYIFSRHIKVHEILSCDVDLTSGTMQFFFSKSRHISMSNTLMVWVGNATLLILGYFLWYIVKHTKIVGIIKSKTKFSNIYSFACLTLKYVRYIICQNKFSIFCHATNKYSTWTPTARRQSVWLRENRSGSKRRYEHLRRTAQSSPLWILVQSVHPIPILVWMSDLSLLHIHYFLFLGIYPLCYWHTSWYMNCKTQ